MQNAYILEFGGKKEVYEMKSLELDNIDNAISWIKETMRSDEEYFHKKIDCNIFILKYEEYDDIFYCKAIAYINTDSTITNEMIQSDIKSIETIIETNLSIISKITCKMSEVN